MELSLQLLWWCEVGEEVVLCCWVAENDDVGASELRQNPCPVPDRHVKLTARLGPLTRYIIIRHVKFSNIPCSYLFLSRPHDDVLHWREKVVEIHFWRCTSTR